MKYRHVNLRDLFLRTTLVVLTAFLFTLAPANSGVAFAQDDSPWKGGQPPPTQPHETPLPEEQNIVGRAMPAVCSERARDPLGSVPIDVMQARPSMPLSHPDAVAGLKRAERLLPAAKEVVVSSLRDLSNEYNIEDLRVKAAAARVMAVDKIEPDVELRDNASVMLS